MIKYFRHSEISFRLGLNPFNWVWIPSGAYDGPTEFYPNRRTYAIAWLGIQLYLDVDDGTENFAKFAELFGDQLEIEEDDELGPEILRTSAPSRPVVKRPKL